MKKQPRIEEQGPKPKSAVVHPDLCDPTLTALPPTIDVAALAALYNSPPKSHVAHEYLLEEARRSLLKYELAEADLELAADSLARATHLLLEQHGLAILPPEQLAELERDILEWYGLRPAPAPMETQNTRTPAHKTMARTSPTLLLQPHTKHGTPLAH